MLETAKDAYDSKCCHYAGDTTMLVQSCNKDL